MEIRIKNLLTSYLKLSKLRVVELLLITTVPSMIVSIYSFPPIDLIFYTLIGGTMLAVSANVLNQIFEVEQDRLMSRTSTRPLVTGEISLKSAYLFSFFTGSLGFFILYFFTTILASYIALSANLFYSFIYTLVLKPRTNQNIVIGGAAGAAPVLIGWTATGSNLDIASWLLFLLVFLWTPAHFWALSLHNVEDYKDANFPMLPTQESEKRTVVFIAVYGCATVITSVLLTPILQLGIVYLYSSIFLGCYLLLKSFQLFKKRIKPINYFVFSNSYLALLFISMIADIIFTVSMF
ncbi:MAG: heme o synthase [Candidatus Actinomarina sp.]